jgi:hypothetical protein
MTPSWKPIPEGVSGTKPKAVMRGWRRKNPTHPMLVIPKDNPRKNHSNPFSTQESKVNRKISGIALWVFSALFPNSSSFPTIRFMNRARNLEVAIFLNSSAARGDQIIAANTNAPISMSPMPMTANVNISRVNCVWYKRNTSPPAPPSTFTRNSIDCMPRIHARLAEASMFWFMRYIGVSM